MNSVEAQVNGETFHVKQSQHTEDGLQCGACARIRPAVLFTKMGLWQATPICQLCKTEAREVVLKTRRTEQPVASKRHLRRYGNPAFFKNRPSALVGAAARRAEKLGLPFDLTADWARKRLLLGRCEVTGIVFELGGGTGQQRSNFTPSIDRIEPSAGYVQDNCRLVIWSYNAAKSTGTDADVLMLARALVAKADGAK